MCILLELVMLNVKPPSSLHTKYAKQNLELKRTEQRINNIMRKVFVRPPERRTFLLNEQASKKYVVTGFINLFCPELPPISKASILQ